MNVLETVARIGIVPIVKVEKAEDVLPLCRALKNGGLPILEIPLRTDAAAEALSLAAKEMPEMLLAAGTVLNCGQVDAAVKAGARIIVTPSLNPEVVDYCGKLGIPVIPGCSSPADVERAQAMGLSLVKFFPAEALGGTQMLKALSGPYAGMSFLPTFGIFENNQNDYLSMKCVAACGGSWMAPAELVRAGDWTAVEQLTRSAVNHMLGLELTHVGINDSSPEEAMEDAKTLCRLFGWTVDDHAKATFAGKGFEVMKAPFRGRLGHIAVGCSSIPRAKWHLEQRGFVFDEESAVVKNGRTIAIYLKDEIAGFAFHLLQK